MGLSHFYFPRKSNGCNWIWYYCPLIQLACSIAFKNQQFDRVRFAIQNFAFCRWNGSSVLFNQLWHSSNHHKISIWSDASIQFFQYFPNERTLHAIDVLLASLRVCLFIRSIGWAQIEHFTELLIKCCYFAKYLCIWFWVVGVHSCGETHICSRLHVNYFQFIRLAVRARARLPYLISMLSDNSAVNGNVFVFPSSGHP